MINVKMLRQLAILENPMLLFLRPVGGLLKPATKYDLFVSSVVIEKINK